MPGVGTGEALNEHVFGEGWPPAPVRLHQVGGDQDGFFRSWEEELRPALAGEGLIPLPGSRKVSSELGEDS